MDGLSVLVGRGGIENREEPKIPARLNAALDELT